MGPRVTSPHKFLLLGGYHIHIRIRLYTHIHLYVISIYIHACSYTRRIAIESCRTAWLLHLGSSLDHEGPDFNTGQEPNEVVVPC